MPTRELELVVGKGNSRTICSVYGVLMANEDSFSQIGSSEVATFWATFTNDME